MHTFLDNLLSSEVGSVFNEFPLYHNWLLLFMNFVIFCLNIKFKGKRINLILILSIVNTEILCKIKFLSKIQINNLSVNSSEIKFSYLTHTLLNNLFSSEVER